MSGFPACADPQIHCFYLFAMPLFALLGPLQPAWFDRIELCHILAAGIGFFLLARELRVTIYAAILVAIIVMFGGSASARLQHTGMIYAYGLLPWCLLLTRLVFMRTSWVYVIGLGICAGSMGVLGDQVAFLNCLVVAAFAVSMLVHGGITKQDTRAPFIRLVLAAVLTLLVMLPQIVPTIELLPLSSRPWIPLENLAQKSLYKWSFLTYLIPDIFRTFDGYVNYIGKNDPSETYLYAGLVPATILLYGGVFRGLLFRKGNLIFLLPLIFFVLYALGTQTPAYAQFWHLIPGVKSFQRPTDATFLINVFLALLIGWMLDRMRPAPGAQPRDRFVSVKVISLSLAFSALVTGGVVFLCKNKVPHVLLQNNTGDFWKLGIFVFLAACLLHGLERTKHRGYQNILITTMALFTFADLQFANSSNVLNTVPAKQYAFDEPDRLNEFSALEILAQLKTRPRGPFRVEMLGSEREMLWWNASNRLQVEATDGMWPINLLSYHQYAGACNPLFGRRFNHWMSGFDSPLFDLLNVQYVLTNEPEADARKVLTRSKFTQLNSLEQYTVYMNKQFLPRAFFVPKCKIVKSLSELSDVIRNANFAPTAEVVVLADDIGGTQQALTEFDSASKSGTIMNSDDIVNWERYEQNDLELSVHCEGDRMLFLSNIYFPGWCADIDGAAVKIYRADYLFQTISVKRGNHKIRFRFQPYSLDALMESRRLANIK